MKKTKKEAYEIAEHYNKWLEKKGCEKSPCTIRAYEITINLYINYLVENQHVKMESFNAKTCFSTDMIEKWLQWLAEFKKCTPQSCNVRLSNIRSFLKYLSEKNYKFMDVYLASTKIGRRKTIKKQIRGVSKEGIKVLLNSIDTSTDTGRRDSILWQTVYLTGLRISEALSIQLKNLNLTANRPSVTIVGKRSKIRTMYLPPVLTENLKVYIKQIFGKGYDENSYLFFSRIGGKLHPMSVKGAELRLKIIAKTANKISKEVPLDLHPHMLRHACATHWLEDGMNIIQVSKCLGHDDISTTMRYLDITDKQTEDAIISMEDKRTNTLHKKWKNETSLSNLFKRTL